MVAAVVSVDRLNAAWSALLNLFMGRKAVKTVDACALYFAKVVAIDGSKVDVQLDTTEIPSPTSIPLYLGLPSSTVEGIVGSRVLVGFRNGDPSQPYAIAFEFNSDSSLITIGTSSPKEAARKDDAITHGTILFTFVPGSGAASLSVVYTPGDGSGVQSLPAGSGTLTIHELIGAGSSAVKIGG